ncbi:hypothetical protein H112_03761 [Trichophyton rubrum D6]|uniref:Rho-gdp dissociation inhibitor n=3 Tax=Trichophyton TaxID=5550 RepID=A0A080WJW0_TRIRC|nr:uncharacterized protein TERG_05090 [Trichophyton rubrum CBS 118892]EZF23509.1 hypothetical protein H100_03770 [Trichophyton rubrum MR850]EZF42465.1 hypothetical protein H102_03758 [Trichophyton rubrum CBS 100081]EZF53077.1 hypothetical protein H103_03771 [Trichophyton rubrum CBS 288.86]EZF63750.1 hypothetical protein H104_03757 [Trichophyton rubrum CBS 289.86]EZF74445.1 hypothetical protein H105_03786 [Trichophyton soudanense CBS 452.61]EZF85025.1 hypothetical protein H110_03763 [Trichophy
MADHEDELATTRTDGFKVGEKKTVEEYQKLDQNDESLNRWKASLGLGSGTPISNPNDPRTCIIKSLALEVAGREDITIDLSEPGAVDCLKDKPFTIKEGCRFRIKATFQVQHDVLSGLKYVQVVKRKGIRVSKDQEMLVCFTYSRDQGKTKRERCADNSLCREAMLQTPRISQYMRRSVSALSVVGFPR